MRIAVQWATSPPSGWQDIQAQAWRGSPSKPDPTGSTVALDGQAGWVNALCVQGVEFSADHYAVEWTSEGPEKVCRVTVWHDDLAFTSSREAHVWTFREYRMDSRRGIFNTRQSLEVFAELAGLEKYQRLPEIHTTHGPVVVRPYAEFVPPQEALVRHGVLMQEAELDAHAAVRGRPDWREWTEGVPASHLHRGRVRITRLEE